jgi:hypothetical protein
MIKTAQQLIENPSVLRPHVVLLGAGASRAAFPNGDATGKRLPVMSDFIEILRLEPLVGHAGFGGVQHGNFEAIYSQLAIEPRHAETIRNIERQIVAYFSNLSLPSSATIYDRLLISLRPTDAVFSFNWDPFLFDAYQRNRDAVPLPEIFFLHGNVRIGSCLQHDRWGPRKERCPDCGELFIDTPLFYPIAQKNYSSDPFISRSWEAAKVLLRDAFTLTIFGYSAPTSDADAVELLRSAWTGDSKRAFEHIEIIDTAPQPLLHARWASFTPTLHYHIKATFEESRIARWSRRSCESLWFPMTQGEPCEEFPLPSTDSLVDLQAYAREIARYESRPR